MAKLFANRFNIDQLPDPVKSSTTPVQASNIRIEPIEQKPLETQALNAQLRTVDNQKANISTSDQILERQGVRKSSSTQYVSTTKIEPFGNKIISQGTANIKKPKDIQDKTSNIVLNSIKSTSVIVDPKVAIAKVTQGDKITDPNISIQKQLFEEKTTNPKISIAKVSQGSKVHDPKVEINKVSVGNKTTNPNTLVKKFEVSNIIKTPKIRIKKVKNNEFIVDPNIIITKTQDTNRVVNPNISIKPVDTDSKITNPNIEIKPVDVGSKIVNPNTTITPITVGDKITDPNTIVRPVSVGNKITNPNTIIQRVKDGDKIVNPKTKIIYVKQGELITNPNTEVNKIIAGDRIFDPKTVINKVRPGELITIPNTVLSQMSQTDVRSYQPDLTGNGNTKLFPRTINLENRLKQALLGSTKHLPEYILSDENTGFLTITSPSVIAKVSAVKIQRIQYEKFILKQGGIEDILKGLISYVSPFKFGERKPKQGSIIIKNNQRFVNKKSPVEIKKLSTISRVTDPKLVIKPIVVGNRTVDPNIIVDKKQKVEIITNPQIAVEIPKANLVVDPRIDVKLPPTIGELTTNPNIKLVKITTSSVITIPKIKTASIKKIGELTTIPKFKLTQPSKPGTSVRNPKTQIKKVAIGSRTFDPKIKPNVVKPGSRTTIPRLVLPLSNITGNIQDPLVKVILFEDKDDKATFAQDVPLFGDIKYNSTVVFPSDNNIPQTGLYVENTKFDPTTVFPGTDSVPPFNLQGSGVSYGNQYQQGGNVFDYTNQDSPLKQAGSVPTPTLTVTYYDGSAITQQKTLVQPQAVYADSTSPGGYKTLTYAQMQARQQRNNRRNLDYTYNEASSADESSYWRTRLGMPNNGADTLNASVDQTKSDFVKIIITSGRGDGTLQFRSYLKSFNDTITPQYTDVNYVGRPDTLKVFKGTTRQVSLGFIVPAFSKDELSVIYQKLNKLVQIAGTGKYTADSVYVQGPFLKITVGNWLVNTPAIAGSIKFDTNPTEYSWDINYEVPQIVDVSLDLTILSSNDATAFLSSGKYINYGG